MYFLFSGTTMLTICSPYLQSNRKWIEIALRYELNINKSLLTIGVDKHQKEAITGCYEPFIPGNLKV